MITDALVFHHAASHCTSEDGPEESLRAKVKTVIFFLRSTEGTFFFSNQVLTRFTLQLRHFMSLLTNFETGLESVRLSHNCSQASSENTSLAKTLALTRPGFICLVVCRRYATTCTINFPRFMTVSFVASVAWCIRVVCRKACLSSLCNASLDVVPEAKRALLLNCTEQR